FLLIRAINRLQERKEGELEAAPITKDCAFCYTSIPVQATRCPHCTSQLD
ncbi:MAG: large conductance mechanosensitive channel protein MscL, partial [Chloroflexi bacterium]|nr:large conductance mechanosensitive channel protein MscL [Chloroflexota bacterium]